MKRTLRRYIGTGTGVKHMPDPSPYAWRVVIPGSRTQAGTLVQLNEDGERTPYLYGPYLQDVPK